jgi:uncharacterized protein (TIGR02599 family)
MSDIDSADATNRPTDGVFFLAPLGEVADTTKYGSLDRTLNCWGYFLEWGDDTAYVPRILAGVVQPRTRTRLMEFRQPTEQNAIYTPGSTKPLSSQNMTERNYWFLQPINLPAASRPVRVLAENVIALLIVPRLSQTDERARLKLLGGSMNQNVPLSPFYLYDSTQNSNLAPANGQPPPAVPAGAHPEQVDPKNQLPPVVQVVMVALDEDSARKLDQYNHTDPQSGLATNSLFKNSWKLEDDPGTTTPDDGELSTLETKLIGQNLNYRIFDTNVTVRGAKWSRAQTQ